MKDSTGNTDRSKEGRKMQHRTLHRTAVGLLLTIMLQVVLAGTSLALSDPQTNDDQSLDNIRGTVVTVDVLDNDTPGAWNASTVRIIDPNDMTTQLTEYLEPDQGTWRVNGDGSITFTPCSGADVIDGTCTAELKDDPFPIDYVVQDTGGALSNPAQVLIGYTDGPLAVTVAYIHSLRRDDGQVEFTWATVSERNNAGFNLLVEGDGGLVPVNDALIASNVVNSVFPQLYEYVAAVDAVEFYVQEVSLSGARHNLGPYAIGETYGELPPELDDTIPDEAVRIYLPMVVAGLE